MKLTAIIPVVICLPLLFTDCSQNNLEVDKSYYEIVNRAFSERMEQYGNLATGMSDVMLGNLDADERLAMEFVYAFMPLSDLADYTGDFHLNNVKQALRSRDEMPWGSSIPAEIFLHFVLPQRVNNENLDSFRLAYYEEISARINGITGIAEAALEINHWCHEKVSYQPSDIRTSAPMSTILSSRGRCGEESTFTVAALRCAGIPARQVYTPRWAHSDDNHAWVEVWVKGEWKYLGACEPEPVLDRGWFTEPARRAMLIHTKTFGAYRGDENTIFSRDLFSEINNLGKYAVTKDIVVEVLNKEGLPAVSASVEFQLYNYAEFYPIAAVQVNESGLAAFRTGLGDLLIWARDGQDFDFRKITVAETDTVTLVLSGNTDLAGRIDFDLFAPLARAPLDGIPAELIKENALLLRKEDSIRQSYIDSWIAPDEKERFATENNFDEESTKEILDRSMGNYKEILSFMKNSVGVDSKMAFDMLEVVSEKDLRDTPSGILRDHLKGASLVRHDNYPEEIFIDYVLNPRIENEIITPWRTIISSYLKDDLAKFRSDPEYLAEWIRNNIQVNNSINYYNVPVSPGGVLKLGQSDEPSLKILFVAVCRTAGIPSRLEPGTREPQFYRDGSWFYAQLTDSESELSPEANARLVLRYTGDVPVPEYYTHFTIAKFKDGRFNTLHYPYNKKITEFTEPLELKPGRYMMVTGNRLDDTRILASVEFFTLEPGGEATIDVRPRTEEEEQEVLGKIDMDLLKASGLLNNELVSSFKSGVVIAWLEKGKEPTIHILNDLPLLRQEFDAKGTTFLFTDVSDDNSDSLSESQLQALPAHSFQFQDSGLKLLTMVLQDRDPSSVSFPYIIYADGEGRIMFRSEGYRIGIGEQILKRIK